MCQVLYQKVYLFQSHLCKNNLNLKKKNIKKVIVPEACFGHCQLSLMDHFTKMVKDMAVYYFCKNISIASDVWQGSKYTST